MSPSGRGKNLDCRDQKKRREPTENDSAGSRWMPSELDGYGSIGCWKRWQTVCQRLLELVDEEVALRPGQLLQQGFCLT